MHQSGAYRGYVAYLVLCAPFLVCKDNGMHNSVLFSISSCLEQLRCFSQNAWRSSSTAQNSLCLLALLKVLQFISRAWIATAVVLTGVGWAESKLADTRRRQQAQVLSPKAGSLPAAAVRQLSLHIAEQLASALTKLRTVDADEADLLNAKLWASCTASACLTEIIQSVQPPSHPECPVELQNLSGISYSAVH